jgi:hypothetical protein
MAGTALDVEPTASSNSTHNPLKVSPSVSSQSNSSYTSQKLTKSNAFDETPPSTKISPSKNQFSSFASTASKPLVLSNKTKNDSDFGWDEWGDKDLLGDTKLAQPNGSVGLRPVLQPERPKKSSANSHEAVISHETAKLGPVLQPERQNPPDSQKSMGNTKEFTMNGWSNGNDTSSVPQKSPGFSKELAMTNWANGNDDWGWDDKSDTFPKKKTSINTSLNLKSNSDAKTNDWNLSPGDDWNSWAEPTTPSQNQRKESNDWGSWGETGTTSISIDKIKGENRKQTLQDSKPKSSRIAGKKY